MHTDVLAWLGTRWHGWRRVCLLAGVLTWPETRLPVADVAVDALTWLGTCQLRVGGLTWVGTRIRLYTHSKRVSTGPSGGKTAGLTYCEYKVLPEQRTQIYAEGVGNNSNRPVNASVRSRMGK